jgi:hypothetical protein
MIRKRTSGNNTRSTYLGIFSLILVLTMALISCSLPAPNQGNLEATVFALSAQSTSLAQSATQESQNFQATALSLQVTQLAQLVQSQSQATQPPPTQAIIQTESVPTSENSQPESDAALESKIKAAKILLFEDVSGNNVGALRYVKEALDSGGYSYTDVGSAQGWFKDQMIAQKEWDLIIAASEMSGRISGEYYDYLGTYLDQGSAMIIEMWGLDGIFQGKIRTILNTCGIEFESNWISPPVRSVWFLVPEHPIFHYPNEIGPSLRDYVKLREDSGDLVEIKYQNGKPTGDAQLLAGTKIDLKDSHGVLTTCYGGRLVLQSFSSHQYHQEDIVKLWQNYVHYTLMNHFKYIQ